MAIDRQGWRASSASKDGQPRLIAQPDDDQREARAFGEIAVCKVPGTCLGDVGASQDRVFALVRALFGVQKCLAPDLGKP